MAGCVSFEESLVSGRKRAYGYTWPQEVQIGQEADQQIVAQYGLYDDPELAAYVDRLGQELLEVSHMRREDTPAEMRNTPFTFRVLDSPVVNAFALPGGYIYITRGILAHLDNEAQLAVVLGHEIGHVTAGHSSLRQERSTIAQGALLGALILGKVLGAGDDVLRSGAQLGQAVAGGYLANYSREDELAADNLGIRYLARAGYDPYAQADFLESMGASRVDAQS